MNVLVERHKDQEEKTWRLECGKCGSELEFTIGDVAKGYVIPNQYSYAKSHLWERDVYAVKCPICGQWHRIDEKDNFLPIKGIFCRSF